MKNSILGSSLVVVLLSACAPLQQSQMKSGKDMSSSLPNPLTCSHKGETRVIERRAAGAGCETAYTKGGHTSVPAKSAKGFAHCDQSAAKIKKNLEAAGWSCN